MNHIAIKSEWGVSWIEGLDPACCRVKERNKVDAPRASGHHELHQADGKKWSCDRLDGRSGPFAAVVRWQKLRRWDRLTRQHLRATRALSVQCVVASTADSHTACGNQALVGSVAVYSAIGRSRLRK